MKFNTIFLSMLFTLSTTFSCQGQNDTTTTNTATVVDSTATTLQPLDHPVEVGNSKPTVFKNTKPNVLTRGTKLDAFFDTLTALKRPCRIVHIGDSHVRGHSYTPEARKVLERAWGSQAVLPQNIDYHTTAIANETGRPGLVYHAMGKNGATCAHFSTEEYVRKVKELKPDLIIISFGTNECHVKNYDTTAHKQELGKLVRKLSEACGESTIMLTTPGGAYFSYKSSYEKMVKQKNGKSVTKKMYKYTYKQNQHTPAGVKVITDFARKKDLALWDMYAICGGKNNSTTNWYDNKLMKADHIHYTHNGYKVQGDMLAEAILTAYNDYIKRKLEVQKPEEKASATPTKQKPGTTKKNVPAKPRTPAKSNTAKPAAKPVANNTAKPTKTENNAKPAAVEEPKAETTTKAASSKPASTTAKKPVANQTNNAASAPAKKPASNTGAKATTPKTNSTQKK